MSEVVQIFEADFERDRKECIKLNFEADGANRKLAQWLLDHPKYSGAQVAIWLNCGPTRITDLRQWAKEGFTKDPSAKRRGRNDSRRNDSRDNPRRAGEEPLKSNNNSVPTEEEAEESYQETLFEQACLLLSEMADETRQRFFAKLKREYRDAA